MIKRNLMTVLCGLATTLPLVSAGSRAWQPAIKEGVRSVNKRWLSLDPNGPLTGIWPGGKVYYCWESDDTANQLGPFLHDAIGLWHSAGLPNDFEFLEHKNCQNPKASERFDYVRIELSPNALWATVGKPKVHNADTEPKLVLSMDDTVGHKDVVVNVAHEIGHSWGLYHEHQNYVFWDRRYTTGVNDRYTVFGIDQGTFKCENLVGYPRRFLDQPGTTYAEKYAAMYDDKTGACKQRLVALTPDSNGFKFDTAASYLPSPLYKRWQVGEQIDYDSVMIYPSEHQSRVNAPGGGKQPILLKKDLTPILPVIGPSAKDVDGLKKLYGGRAKRIFQFYGAKASKLREKFRNIRRTDPANGCN